MWRRVKTLTGREEERSTSGSLKTGTPCKKRQRVQQRNKIRLWLKGREANKKGSGIEKISFGRGGKTGGRG